MTSDYTDQFQLVCDFDGDLHLFPKNLDEPDYHTRWRVWVIQADASRKEASLCTPVMCVNDGVVTNRLGTSGHQQVAGCFVDSLNASEIEISIASGPFVRIRHPWRYID